MKLFLSFLICFYLTAGAAQTTASESFQPRGKFTVGDGETIFASELFDDETKLRLVGARHIQVWDLKTQQTIEKIPHDIEFPRRTFGGLSADKSKFVVLSDEIREKDQPVRAARAAVYDARTGKLLKILETEDGSPVRAVLWSANGATLVTADRAVFGREYGYQSADGDLLLAARAEATEINLWDGATLERRGALRVENITWRYITPDGARLLIAAGPKRSILGFPYASEKAATIDVFDARTGKLEKQLKIGDETFFVRTRKLKVAPDGNTLAFVVKSRENDRDERLQIWKINGATAAPLYIIKANPKIADSDIGYTPDGDFLALDAGKNAQIYRLSSGAKTSEIINVGVPNFWLDDNRIALYDKDDKIRAIRVADGKLIYEENVIYRTVTRDTGDGTTDAQGNYVSQTETIVEDFTRLLPSANGKLLLTYSNQAVEIRDAATGKLRQTLVAAPAPVKRKVKLIGITIGGYQDFGERTVASAEWSQSNQKILIANRDNTSIAVWEK